jgi:hypothetical protein
MKDVDINEDSIDGKVGRAMAIFLTNTAVQGIQVCPGVFLTTAHVNLDNPLHANCSEIINPLISCKNRPLKKATEHFKAAFHYPISAKTLMKATSDEQFISPIKTWRDWYKHDYDYVFIKMDKPVRPDEFIQPLNISRGDLLKINQKGYKTYLYRGKTKFEINSKGIPNLNIRIVPEKNAFKFYRKLYEKPQRVIVNCRLASWKLAQITVSDCPTEAGVSGSPMITVVNNKPYLTGLHIRGTGEYLKQFNNGRDQGAIFINSPKFCEDYLLACGRPCVTLEEALKEE